MSFPSVKTIRRGLLLALPLAVIGGVLLWRSEPAPAFATEAVSRGDVEATVVAIGTLQPRESVDVGAQVSGQVTRLHVEPGDPVEKGQLLAEIDASLHQATVEADRAALDGLRAQLEEQQAQFELAQQQHQRQQRLAVDEATREEDVQVAAASLKAAQARLKQLRAQIAESRARLKGNEAQLSYTRLYAPIAGTVLGVDVKQGQTLNATYQTPTVLRIADLSAMTAWTKVSEADIRQLKPGLGLYFTTLGGDGRRWHAKIRQILPSPPLPPAASGDAGAAPVTMKAVQYTVLFDVDNQDGELMPQMTAQVTFVTAAARDVLTAPLEALQAVEGKSGVFTARILNGKGRPEPREVQIGARSRQRVEVLDGLQENEQLITAELPDTRVARFQW
ncbi:efflux RND transporter periplasmic adaptor subunit [Aquipseudomonas ullengensis]|uniref:Efflux RND transporter periplasmic adaptor subunit n=1 Tax=Aquipseudomonas ullengensis TaxID=2759166 RepID=A0A7W4QDA4_9GAMM|nr:efflux RND transporter periplasmic adaptor subunit [Pseudomonas ullengensis]MBB2494343.1 efflux RND transporter periplasmic adaptor subunit [Pseudomonas ullengensis]